MASSPDSAALPCRFPRARGAGRLRPTRASRRLLFSDIGSERTLLRRLAAVDISLGAGSVWRRGVVGGAGRGAASYGVKVRNSPIATISVKRGAFPFSLPIPTREGRGARPTRAVDTILSPGDSSSMVMSWPGTPRARVGGRAADSTARHGEL